MSQIIPDGAAHQIIQELERRGALKRCPMCSTDVFNFEDGYLTPVLQADIDRPSFSGRSIPCVVVTCLNCGFVSQHALGALGMLPRKDDAR